MKTIRVRRSRPGPVALAIALLLTMLAVYLITLGVEQADSAPTAGLGTTSAAELKLPARDIAFSGAWADTALDARVLAAQSGAAAVRAVGERYFVVERICRDEAEDEPRYQRSAGGLTLALSGDAAELAALAAAQTLMDELIDGADNLAAAIAEDAAAADAGGMWALWRSRARECLRALAASDNAAGMMALKAGLATLTVALEDTDAPDEKCLNALSANAALALMDWMDALAEAA